ncbi:MAG: hypothetical protein R3F11_24180 [Verrucomicrobiales bacterium]
MSLQLNWATIKPWILGALAFLGGAIFGCGQLRSMARNDAEAFLMGYQPDARIIGESFHPSATYIVYFTFEIEGGSDLSRIYWRGRPFGAIEIEK